MAYMDQENKRALAPGIKAVLKKYGMKGTIAIRHYSTLVVNVKSGGLDIISNYVDKAKPEHDINGHISVNPYWIKDHYTGEVCNFLCELKSAMNAGGDIKNHDNSEPMTDYFDVGWYIEINIGNWERPYLLS